MTKKLLLLSISIFILKASSFGQACSPASTYTNTNTQRGIWPDTLVNFATATVGVPYSQLVTIVIPHDTTSGPPLNIHFNWDSTVMASVSGLPTSLTYACWNTSVRPNNCTWPGNSIGCAIITGTPTTADIGTHKLLFTTDNYIHTAGNQVAVVKGYKIIVSAANAVNEVQDAAVLLQNSPNPFSDKTEISFTTEENGTAQLKIYNLLGSVVQQSEVRVNKGMNKIQLDAKNFDSGVYFYSLVYGNNVSTRKMVINK